MTGDRWHRPFDLQQLVDSHLGRSQRIFHGEHDIIGNLDELSYEGEIAAVRGNRKRPVEFFPRHEHAGDVRHSAGNAGCFLENYGIEIQVTAELPQNLGAAAFGHRFGNKVADPIRMQCIAPKHLNVVGLIDKMRLMVKYDRHQPI